MRAFVNIDMGQGLIRLILTLLATSVALASDLRGSTKVVTPGEDGGANDQAFLYNQRYHFHRIATLPERSDGPLHESIASEVFITNDGCNRDPSSKYACTSVQRAPEHFQKRTASSSLPFVYDAPSGAMRRLQSASSQMIKRSGEISVLYAMVVFSDRVDNPFTQQIMDERKRTLDELSAFYGNVTNGKMKATFTLYPSIIALDKPSTHYASLERGFFDMRTDAMTAIDNIMSYDMDIFEHAYIDVGWAGKGNVGARGVLINGPQNADAHVISHEMGHNFGLEHANWNYIKEYGDDYDVMGNSPLDESVLEFPYNAAYRVALGWIPPARVAWATFPADRQIIADLVPCTDYSDPFKTSIQAIVVTMDEGRETLVVSARLLKDGSIGAVLRLYLHSRKTMQASSTLW